MSAFTIDTLRQAQALVESLGPARLRIIQSEAMVDTVEDWSDVRSPPRAQRRLKRGFKQRIRYHQVPKRCAYQVGGMVIVHPEIYRQLRLTHHLETNHLPR